jgi:putative hydrolase of HD superfamily
VLATLEGDVDVAKVMKICLFHDLAEARTSDLNYVHQKYTHSDELSAAKDLAKTLPFGDEIIHTLNELKDKKTKEALVAKDADQIEFILSLKEQADTGNNRATTWIPSAVKRLKTEKAKELAQVIIDTESDDWWFSDKDSDWWVNRGGENMDKRF